MNTQAIKSTKFKLPNFKFPLKTEDMIVIFMHAFVGQVIMIYKNQMLYNVLLVVLIILCFWSFNIMKDYSLKEAIAIEKVNKSKLFSPNFITDLLIHISGSIIGFLILFIVNPNLDYDFVSNFVFLFAVRLLIRARYYYEYKF